MKKSYKRLVTAGTSALVAVMGLSGCSNIDIDRVDQELVVEYAVNAVINHDKNYIVKMAKEPEEETTIDSEEPTTENNNQEPSQGSNDGTTASINDALGLSGITVSSDGYTVVDKYPDDNDGFSMVAVSGYDLLILKFNCSNTSGSDVNLNMSDGRYKYRVSVNGSSRLNVQTTLLPNALNTWNGVIKNGETEEMVLVFQISEELSAKIQKLGLLVVTEGGTSTVIIK